MVINGINFWSQGLLAFVLTIIFEFQSYKFITHVYVGAIFYRKITSSKSAYTLVYAERWFLKEIFLFYWFK